MGLDAIDPQAHCFSDMLNPALSPEHALLPTFPSTGRLPSAISRRLGVDPDVHSGVYFPAYSGNSAPAVCLLGKILLDPPSASARYLARP